MSYGSHHVEILIPKTGYNLTQDEYKKYWSHLNSFYNLDFRRFVPRERKAFRIMDLGAGDGRMYQQLKTLDPTEYYVCDCAQELLTHHPGKVKKIVCDLDEDWSFESGYFDFLSAFFVLEHIQDTEHFFDEAYRILRDQGQLLIGHFLQKRLFTRNINGKKFKIRQYPHTIEELEETAKRCGFQTGIMPLYDVCTPSLITGHLLVCEKHSLHPSSKVYSNN